MTASQLLPPSLPGAASSVLGGGSSSGVVVVRGLSESPAAFINARLPSDTTDDDFTPDEWEEVKQQVLAKICADTLDTPDAHLSYVRDQLALANACYV